MGIVEIRGRVMSGQGQGAAFTQLTWVRAQFVAKLGIDPYPGTLNLWLDEPAELEKWRQLKAQAGVRIEPATPDFCEAKGFPAMVAPAILEDLPKVAGLPASEDYVQPAAIILPDVLDYPHAQVELIAAVPLRDALNLQDGDTVIVRVEGGGRS